MKTHFIALLFTCIAGLSYAQDTTTLKGEVRNTSGEPLVYVAVRVFATADSTFVIGDVTNEEGVFTLKLANGSYYLKVSYLSYTPQTIGDITLKGDSVTLLPIILTGQVSELKSTEISYEKSTVELTIDKKVFNVGKDISTQGKDALSILGKVPSVNVNQAGEIKVNGSSNVRVLIDGRPIPGSTTDVLRSIPADNIEKIEVISNPSARYDAEGEAGIINIILKKQRQKGFEGSVTNTAGYPLTYSNSGNFGIRGEKLSAFSAYRYEYSTSRGEGTFYQRYTADDTALIYDQKNNNDRINLHWSYRGGMEYQFNKYNATKLTVSVNGGNEEDETYYHFLDRDAEGNTAQEVKRNTLNEEPTLGYGTTVTHTKTYDVKNKKWETTGSYNISTSGNDITVNETGTNYPSPLRQFSFNDQTQYSVLLKTDYYHPLTENSFIETGLKTDNDRIQNPYRAQYLNMNEEWVTLDSIDNDLRYSIDVLAAYAMYGNTQKRFKYQAGLRAEYTGIGLELLKTQQKYPQEYINLFPSAHVSYHIDSFSGIQMSYSRRIFRPFYYLLLPQPSIDNTRNSWRGNPNLKPLFADSYELAYVKDHETGSLLINFDYGVTRQEFNLIRLSDADGTVRQFPINLASTSSQGLDISIEQGLTGWWDIYLDVYGYHSVTKGVYEGVDYGVTVNSWYTEISSTFYIGEFWELQLDADYYAGGNIVQGRDKSIYIIDLSMGKTMMKEKGRLVLSVEDIFNSDIDRMVINNSGLYQNRKYQYQKRQFTLSFTYRFDKKTA